MYDDANNEKRKMCRVVLEIHKSDVPTVTKLIVDLAKTKCYLHDETTVRARRKVMFGILYCFWVYPEHKDLILAKSNAIYESQR